VDYYVEYLLTKTG